MLLVRYREIARLNSTLRTLRVQASNVGVGSGGYEEREEQNKEKTSVNGPTGDNLPKM